MREYYCYRIRLRSRLVWLLWYENELDGVVTNNAGFVLSFESPQSARAFADSSAIAQLNDTQAELNLNTVLDWLTQPNSGDIDCNSFLDAWNLFGDILASVPASVCTFVGGDARYTPIYDKLVAGCNLPALGGLGEPYSPVWTPAEIRELRGVLASGLEDLESRLVNWRPN